MSGEQLTTKIIDSTIKTRSIKSNNLRVNINDLLAKVRKENDKEKKENYIFLGIICSVVVSIGIITSL